MRIPPIKIVEQGRENQTALAIIVANSRVPRNVLGDLRSQRASLRVGEQRPVAITAPEGCFLNPRPPAGGGPRPAICTRIFEVVLGALAPAVPEAVTAANSHFCNATFGAWDPVRSRRFVGYELIHGGIGARGGKDGCKAMSSPYNAANIPVEAVEAAIPVIVERFEFIPDSCGRGKYRGGLGVRRDVRILGESIKFTNFSERHRFPPFGVMGGTPARVGRTVINPDTAGEYEIGGKASVDLSYGDVVSFRLAGRAATAIPRSGTRSSSKRTCAWGWSPNGEH